MRGEYKLFKIGAILTKELPPRARRIRLASSYLLILMGTTSACAENTRRAAVSNPTRGNYLRVRGEYVFKGLSLGKKLGTTSACAENTQRFHRPWLPYWNYLRVRGEY